MPRQKIAALAGAASLAALTFAMLVFATRENEEWDELVTSDSDDGPYVERPVLIYRAAPGVVYKLSLQ